MNNKPTVAISTDFLTAYAALPRQKQGNWCLPGKYLSAGFMDMYRYA